MKDTSKSEYRVLKKSFPTIFKIIRSTFARNAFLILVFDQSFRK